MSGDLDSGLLAPSDVADLAGVSRAAVSNWRRRDLKFPAPVGGTKANPLFDRADVERWLRGRRPQQPRADRASGGLALWSVINGALGDMSMHEMQTLALSVLCARKLAAGTDQEPVLRREAARGRFLQVVEELADAPDADHRWHQLVSIERGSLSGRSVDRLTEDLYGVVDTMAVEELAKAADYVVNRVIARQGRTTGEHGAVSSPVSRLLAEVASAGDPLDRAVAYDPACGIGEALLEFWRRSRNRERVHLYGAEIDADYARICQQRCFLHGAAATVECGDVLVQDPLPDVIADVVLAEPPFGLQMPSGFSLADSRWAVAGLPPKGDAASAWIQHVVAHLAPTGRGLVVTALNVTSGPSSAGIRRALVQRGCVEAVVALPRKLLSYTPIQTALWILRPPGRSDAAERIMFIDASSLDLSERLDLRMISTKDWADDNPDTLTTYVEAEEILSDEQSRLDPQYWNAVTFDLGEFENDYDTAGSAMAFALRNIADTELTFEAIPRAARTVTIRELEKQGALSIIRGGSFESSQRNDVADREAEGKSWQRRLRERRAAEEDASPQVATQRMIRDGKLGPHRGQSPPTVGDQQGFADTDDPGNKTLTKPGDILAVSGRAVVDDVGGWLPGTGVSRVTVDRRQLEPHYIADCMNGTWNQRAGLTPSASVPIRDLEIPLVSLEDQQRLAKEFQDIRELASYGRLLATAADGLISGRLEAIRHDVHLSSESFSGERQPKWQPSTGHGPF